jgi:hypothetical protein
VAHPIPRGSLQIAESGMPIQTRDDTFSAFPAVNWFFDGSGDTVGLPLLTDSGKWHTATNLFLKILAEGLFLLLMQERQAYFCYQMVCLLSAICNRRPMDMDKPQILF